jgi:hypothetical protein
MAIVKKQVPRMTVEQVVGNVIAAQDRARQLRLYNVLGRLYSLETDKGRIQFDSHKGPGIAQEIDPDGQATGQLLFVSPLGELPLVPEYSEAFCPACLTKCDICNGKGKAGCIYVGCGGRGRVQAGEEACPGCVLVKGKFDLACETCGGHGAVPHYINCPACNGSGKADCGPCRGTGKRPSGRNKKNTEMCAACRGSQRAGRHVPQDLAHLVVGKMGNNLVIGPVTRMIVTPVAENQEVARMASRWNNAEASTTAFLRIKPERDESGQPMLVLLPLIARGQPMIPYFFGGGKF